MLCRGISDEKFATASGGVILNATDSLSEDHRTIERMLAVLATAAERLDRGEKVRAGLLREAVDFVRSFADKAHHGKEETNLFPRMAERGVPTEGGPLAVMLHEHDAGRAHVAAIDGEIDAYEGGDAAAARTIAENVRGFVALLSEHIWKEDNVLFPMADQALTAADQEEMEARFAEVEVELMGPEKRARYEEMVSRAEREMGL
jgi:hemerythrin-like domain-containing protein